MGLACAFGAAICRVVSLLATRTYLGGTDARVTTWYSLVPSGAIFLLASLIVGVWHLPQTHVGWLAFLGISFGSTLSTLLIYMSTNTVGPFRTALVMNLEPLLTAILSMILLGEIMTPLQMTGAGIMIAALCIFQFVRGR
jgi:drug/metabolite transporter (DMT)-like permease